MNNNKSEVNRARKKYSPQFKDQAVERAEKDGVSQVAKDLGITETILYRWRAKKRQGGDTTHMGEPNLFQLLSKFYIIYI